MKSLTRNWFLGLAGCLAPAALWTIVAVPGTALAKKPEGGGGGKTEAQEFSVLPQPAGSEDINGDGVVNELDHGMLIRGEIIVNEEGILDYDANTGDDGGFVNICGRADSNIVINRPSLAIQRPMLVGFMDENDGTDYEGVGNDPFRLSGGPLVIVAASKRNPASAIYFFRTLNKIGEPQTHRLDAVADITGPESDPLGANFPNGIAVGEVYTVTLTNWFLSHDTGSGKQAFNGPVVDEFGDPKGETVIQLKRKQ
jgi:hypothetical protein